MKWHWFICIVLLALVGCKDDEDDTSNSISNNIRQQEIEQIVANQILPDFSEASADAQLFTSVVASFHQNPTVESLEKCRETWAQLAASWMELTPTEVGAARYTFIYSKIYGFPCNTEKIDGITSTQNTSETAINAPSDARGLATIEYLLFGNEQGEQILFLNQDFRLDYLLNTAEALEKNIEELNTFWKDDYANTFSKNEATGTSEPVSLLFNGMTISLENLKNYELGDPLGLTGSAPNYELQRAWRSNHSRLLIVKQLTGLQELFGNGNQGYAGMIRAMNLGHSESLAKQVEEAFSLTIEKANQTPDNWNAAMQTNDQSLIDLHTQLKELIRLMKSDVASHLSITITLSDADGD